ncbi:MAG: ribose-5-phosphate isomerase, partial [Acidimicrobiia bacterium]
MRVAIGADHAGRPLVARVAEAVRTGGHTSVVVEPDGGARDDDDYPDVARAVTA